MELKDDWIRQNGIDLEHVKGEEWVCLNVPSAIKTAKYCFKNNIPYFLPLSYNNKTKKYSTIWNQYIIVRLDSNKIKKFEFNTKPYNTLRTFNQNVLLKEIKRIPALSKIENRLRLINSQNLKNVKSLSFSKTGEYLKSLDNQKIKKGSPVLIQSGTLKGVIGNVFNTSSLYQKKLVISYEMLGQTHRVTLNTNSIKPLSSKEVEILNPVDLAPIESKIKESIKIETQIINAELIKCLSKNPNLLYELHPRKFEELIADLLKDMGYTVTLTPQTRDGGIDIIAVMPTPLGDTLTIVECKRHSPSNTVGIDYIERFLFSLKDKFKASCGMMATTSFFSQDAITTQKTYKWQLQLKDFNSIKEWLDNYGNWTQTPETGIWLPKT